MNWQDMFVRLVKAALPKAKVTFHEDLFDEPMARVRIGEHWRTVHIEGESLESLEDAAWNVTSGLMFTLVNGERCKIAAEERRSSANTYPVATGTEVKP